MKIYERVNLVVALWQNRNIVESCEWGVEKIFLNNPAQLSILNSQL